MCHLIVVCSVIISIHQLLPLPVVSSVAVYTINPEFIHCVLIVSESALLLNKVLHTLDAGS